MTHFVLPKSSAHALFLQPMRSEYGPDVSYGFSLPDSSYFSLFLPHFFPTNSKDSKKNRKNILCSSEKLIYNKNVTEKIRRYGYHSDQEKILNVIDKPLRKRNRSNGFKVNQTRPNLNRMNP